MHKIKDNMFFIMNMMKREMENMKNNANITCRDKSTISEMKNTIHRNYSRFHTGNKNASGTEVTATGKYGALKNKPTG